MPSSVNTRIFPMESTVSNQNKIAVCFSGGGSRALTAALGQMRGLNHLGLFNEQNIGLISSVSGGTWASTLYTYRDISYDNDIFLGTVVKPENLEWDNDKEDGTNLSYLNDHNMGIVTTTLSPLELAAKAVELRLIYDYPWSEIWVRVVGDKILSHFQLNPLNAKGEPSQYVGDTVTWAEDNAAGLPVDAFQNIPENSQRPPLVINTSIYTDYENNSFDLYPFEINGIQTGIASTLTVDDITYGGGFSNAYAFNSTNPEYLGDNIVAVNPTVASLADAAGLSSAFYSTLVARNSLNILEHKNCKELMEKMAKPKKSVLSLLDNKIDKLKSELKDHIQEELQDLTDEKLAELNLAGLIPEYEYWPVEGVQEGQSQAQVFRFADGGNLENSGITPLIRKGYRKILAFINTSNPLSMENGQLSVTDYLAALFGYTPMLKLDGDKEAKYHRFADLTEQQFQQLSKTLQPYYQNQIFSYGDFDKLLELLENSSSHEGKLNQKPAAFFQQLTTVENKKFSIYANQLVDVVWFYLTPAEQWNDLLSTKVKWKVKLEYSNFPNYNTVTEIGLDKQQVNLMANFTCWMVTESADLIKQLSN